MADWLTSRSPPRWGPGRDEWLLGAEPEVQEDALGPLPAWVRQPPPLMADGFPRQPLDSASWGHAAPLAALSSTFARNDWFAPTRLAYGVDDEAHRFGATGGMPHASDVAMPISPPAVDWPAAGMPATQPTHDALSTAFDAAGKLWTLPNTLLGLIYGGAGLLAGKLFGTNPEFRFRNNAIEFLNNPLSLSAVTLGNAINYSSRLAPDRLEGYHSIADHERQHTYQAQLLGPLYLPAALLSLALGTIVNGNPHGAASFMEIGPQSDPPRPW